MTFTAKSANGLKKVKEFIERRRGTTLPDTAIKTSRHRKREKFTGKPWLCSLIGVEYLPRVVPVFL